MRSCTARRCATASRSFWACFRELVAGLLRRGIPGAVCAGAGSGKDRARGGGVREWAERDGVRVLVERFIEPVAGMSRATFSHPAGRAARRGPAVPPPALDR